MGELLQQQRRGRLRTDAVALYERHALAVASDPEAKVSVEDLRVLDALATLAVASVGAASVSSNAAYAERDLPIDVSTALKRARHFHRIVTVLHGPKEG